MTTRCGLRLPCSLLLLAALALPVASAQALRLGLVVSQSGAAAADGRAQASAAQAFETRLNAAGGVFGQPLELVIADDASDPVRAARLAAELIEEGVDALICCTTPAASTRVAGLAQERSVLLLAPSGLAVQPQGSRWAFSLAADDAVVIRALVGDASRQGYRALGLMTLDNRFGEEISARLEAQLAAGSMVLAGEARYRPDATALTPEALWVATRNPDAVVVWGLARDVELAVAGLRRRGYRGPIYARPEVLDPLAGGVDLFALEGVVFPVGATAVWPQLSPQHPSYRAAEAYDRLVRGLYGSAAVAPGGAVVYDALALLGSAYEQVVALGVVLERVEVRRQALRDALIGLGPVAGAAGVYDLTEREASAALPSGLVLAVARSGRLEQPSGAR